MWAKAERLHSRGSSSTCGRTCRCERMPRQSGNAEPALDCSLARLFAYPAAAPHSLCTALSISELQCSSVPVHATAAAAPLLTHSPAVQQLERERWEREQWQAVQHELHAALSATARLSIACTSPLHTRIWRLLGNSCNFSLCSSRRMGRECDC